MILGRTENISVDQEALTSLLLEKRILTKEKFLEVVRMADREMKRKSEKGTIPK